MKCALGCFLEHNGEANVLKSLNRTCLYIEDLTRYSNAYVLLNLLNELGKKIRCETLPMQVTCRRQ